MQSACSLKIVTASKDLFDLPDLCLVPVTNKAGEMDG